MALATMSVNEGKRLRCWLVVAGTREEEEEGRCGGVVGDDRGVERSSGLSGHCELSIGLHCVYGARN